MLAHAFDKNANEAFPFNEERASIKCSKLAGACISLNTLPMSAFFEYLTTGIASKMRRGLLEHLMLLIIPYHSIKGC